MITSILRLFLTRSIKPFVFIEGQEEIQDLNLKNLGLYVHIPFCKEICSFCPYYKIRYSKELIGKYVECLLEEIKLSGELNKEKISITSIYFSGDRIRRTVKKVDKIKKILNNTKLSMVQASILFILAQDAVGTVIPGMRNERYVLENTSISDMEPLDKNIIEKFKKHNWIRTSWVFE